MEYTARLKNGQPRKRSKPSYSIRNWSAYNASLKKRGQLSAYLPPGEVRGNFINEQSYELGVSGRLALYSDGYIELIFLMYKLHGWGMRQITGRMQEWWSNLGLDIPVPCIGSLSERFSGLGLKVKQHCQKVIDRVKAGESVSIIIDSTGLKFGNAQQWHEVKYGHKTGKTPWRKLHIAMDEHMNFHQCEVTDNTVADSTAMDTLMTDDVRIDKVFADGTYYDIQRNEALVKKGITPVIPPPVHATVHNREGTAWHDKIVQYILDKGIYAFYQKHGYGTRSLVESQFSRIKRCLGERLLTRKLDSQKNEGFIIANIINLWNSFGRCQSYKTA